MTTSPALASPARSAWRKRSFSGPQTAAGSSAAGIGPRRDELGDARGGLGHGEAVALTPAVAEGEEVGELLVGLDPLGDHLDAQRPRHRQEARGERRVRGAIGQAADERAVELDLVDRQRAQLRDRGRGRSVVVEREAHAEIAELGEPLGVELGAPAQRRLGDLDHQPRRVEPGPLEEPLDPGDQRVGDELLGGDVERELEPAGRVGRGDRREVRARTRSRTRSSSWSRPAGLLRDRDEELRARRGRARGGAIERGPRSPRSARSRCPRSAGRRASAGRPEAHLRAARRAARDRGSWPAAPGRRAPGGGCRAGCAPGPPRRRR